MGVELRTVQVGTGATELSPSRSARYRSLLVALSGDEGGEQLDELLLAGGGLGVA